MKNEFVDRRSITIGSKPIELESAVYREVELDDRIVLLLDPDLYNDNDLRVGQNILCFDLKGELLWRVQSHGRRIPNAAGQMVPEAYFGLWLEEGTMQLKCGAIQLNFDLDPDTGEISNMEWTR